MSVLSLVIVYHTTMSSFKGTRKTRNMARLPGQLADEGWCRYGLTAHRHSVMNRAIMKAKGYLFADFVGNGGCWWWQHGQKESVRTHH
jgi:hypothetical protein